MFEIVEGKNLLKYAIDQENGLVITFTTIPNCFRVYNKETDSTQTIVARTLRDAIALVENVDFTKQYVTGVISNHSAHWLWDDVNYHSIDLATQQILVDYPEEKHDEIFDCVESGDHLIGFVECNEDEAWFSITGEYGEFHYKPDENAEYSAIVRESVTQVVLSKFFVKCLMCSPCYPNQGDLDNPSEIGVNAYALPLGLFDSDIDIYPVNKIMEVV